MTDARDPGWRPAIVGGILGLVPLVGSGLVRRSKNSLLLLRQLWVTFTTALVLVGVVVFVLRSALDGGGIDGRIVAAVVIVVGVATQVVAPRFLPTVAGNTDAEVRRAAARGVFLRIALAESVALMAFVGVIVSGNAGIYVLGFVIGITGMMDAAPTAAWLDRAQQQLRESGSSVDVLSAMTGGGPD
ncbi:MAG: hypothetical protein R8F63_17940 [Acidimicrobiales bacterium]|nr:hypothetical protein [Acidimicrobiales bacterium]